QCGHIEVKNCLFFLPLVLVLLAQPYDRADGFGVKTLALHLCIDILDVVRDVFLFFFEAFDALDEGSQLTCGNGLGGFVYDVVHSLLRLRFFSRTLAAKWLMVRCRRERRKSSRDKMTSLFRWVSGRQVD